MKRLSGRTAIVTGASRGIGPYICRSLAHEGVRLVLAARSNDALERVAAELREGGAKALAVQCDVTSEADRTKLVEAAEAEFGTIDILVNNAGVENTHAYDTLPPDEIAQIIEVNLTAPMLLTRAVLPGMVARKRGHIVNIASLAGKVACPYELPYSASKAGLIQFTESLRSEYRSRGVSGSVICPGFVSDAGMYDDMVKSVGIKASVLAGTSSPEKVAAAVVKCIKRDRPEAIVNPGPMRILTAFAELAPRTFERVFPLFGSNKLFERAAKYNEDRPPGTSPGTPIS